MARQHTLPTKLMSVAAILTLCVWLFACGGAASTDAPGIQSPGDNSNSTAEQTTLFVGLTDAEGDFLEYQVEVLSVALTLENGVVVETLPLSTQVDFAQYTEVTEFLTAATVPVGRYQSASLTLDYAHAIVQTEDANGDPSETIVVDQNGAPAGVVTLEVKFADADGFRILPGIPAHITLDFDLAGSHELDQTLTPAQAQLSGVLLADTLLEDPKTRRARGLLQRVDVINQRFSIDLRPFYRRTGRFGELNVSVADDTEYEINGIAYTGQDGLIALDAEPVNTPVVSTGLLSIAERRYQAKVVYAGSSVPFGELDIATGTVMSRNGDQLMLRGAVLVNKNHQSRRVRQLPVRLSDSTHVTQVKSSFAEYNASEISVGQRITVMGNLESGSTGDVQLNAESGHVRMLFSQVHARVNEAGPLVVDVANINQQRAGLFDFSGTGAATDSDPKNYQIDTASLPLTNIDINDAIKVRGFVAPYGTAPYDFLAQSAGDVSSVPGRSWVRWADRQSTGALLSADENAVVLDISGAQRAVHFHTGHIPFNMQSVELPWSVSPPGSGRGMFALITRDSRQVFSHFTAFVDALLAQLGGEQTIARVRSKDVLDAAGLNSTAKHLVIYLR